MIDPVSVSRTYAALPPAIADVDTDDAEAGKDRRFDFSTTDRVMFRTSIRRQRP